MDTLKALLGTMRVPFLMLTPACVVVGVGTAYRQTHELNWVNILLVLVGALSAHISVNRAVHVNQRTGTGGIFQTDCLGRSAEGDATGP